MSKQIIVCQIIRNHLLKKDPFCFTHFSICECVKQNSCHVKNKTDTNYFPINYKQFKQIIKKNL